jgi:hypothetical protein
LVDCSYETSEDVPGFFCQLKKCQLPSTSYGDSQLLLTCHCFRNSWVILITGWLLCILPSKISGDCLPSKILNILINGWLLSVAFKNMVTVINCGVVDFFGAFKIHGWFSSMIQTVDLPWKNSWLVKQNN